MSPAWNAEVESIIRKLARERNHYTMIEVLLKEGMLEKAAGIVLRQDDLWTLAKYHDKLCALYPKKYYTAYRKHIDELAKKAHKRDDYRDVKKYLKIMKTVPKHKREFGEFVDRLRERHARQPAFLDEIKSF